MTSTDAYTSRLVLSHTRERTHALLVLGDYGAGAIVGAATAAGVRAAVSPTLDMVLAMLLGMAVGMVIHLLIALPLSPVLGTFHVMVPGSLIGMYGGMLFAMRDTMQHPPPTWNDTLLVGALFGLAVTAGVQLYDRALRGPAASGDC